MLSAFSLDVHLSPSSGSTGAPVTLRVRPSGSEVAGVRVSIIGYGFEENLQRDGGEWVAQTMVPYEAMPGEYLLDVYAVDASGSRVSSARASFTVTG